MYVCTCTWTNVHVYIQQNVYVLSLDDLQIFEWVAYVTLTRSMASCRHDHGITFNEPAEYQCMIHHPLDLYFSEHNILFLSFTKKEYFPVMRETCWWLALMLMMFSHCQLLYMKLKEQDRRRKVALLTNFCVVTQTQEVACITSLFTHSSVCYTKFQTYSSIPTDVYGLLHYSNISTTCTMIPLAAWLTIGSSTWQYIFMDGEYFQAIAVDILLL